MSSPSDASKGQQFMPGQSRAFPAAVVEETEEERKLVEQSRCSSFYHEHTKLIKVLMALSSVELVAAGQTNGLQPVGDDAQKREGEKVELRNVLQPVVAVRPEQHRPNDCKPGISSWFYRLVWPLKIGLLATLYRHYTFVKLLLLANLSLERHIILSHLKLNVKPQAHRTNSCALKEDLYFSKPADLAEYGQLKSLEAWLKFLGMNMVSVPELSVASMFIIAIMPPFYHHMWQLLLSLNRQRNDTLHFMLDPLSERRRMRAELRKIVHEMILSLSNHRDNLYYSYENSTSLHDNDLEVSSSSRSLRSWKQASGLIGRRSRCRPKPAASADLHEVVAASHRGQLDDGQMRRLHYHQTLIKIERLEQVGPYIMTSKWHRTFLRQTDLILRRHIYAACTAAALMTLVSLFYDLSNDTRLRLETVECAKWRPQGGTRIVSLNHLYLNELQSAEQLDAYKAYDGSTLGFLKLALLVESTSYFSLRRIICWTESVLAGYIVGFEWLLGSALQLASTAEKITWLHQLEQQVDDAANQAAAHAHLVRRFGPTQAADERMSNTLTLVYLNYELFRRQHDEYLLFTDSITICITMLSMMICLIIYLTGMSLGSSSPILIFSFCSPSFASINLFLVASSYRYKRMEKIMSKVSRILAHCSSGPIQLSYPMELWRRQVRAFVESNRRYASRLLGIRVTYETVITLNGYAIAMLLILLKPQQSPLY